MMSMMWFNRSWLAMPLIPIRFVSAIRKPFALNAARDSTGSRVTTRFLTALLGEARQTIGSPFATHLYGVMWLPQIRSILPAKSASSATRGSSVPSR